MENMWDKRYAGEEFIYGKKANEFLREHLQNIKPGTLLLPGEGEGRNAVHAALLGWNVKAFDSSIVGKQKAEKLAKGNKVEISYSIASYEEADFEEDSFDLIALVYTHSLIREALHHKMLRFLKPGGTILLEGFSKEQLEYGSGGPGNPEMLYSLEEIESDFKSLSEKKITIKEVVLDEGSFHLGKASVLRMIGKK